MRRAATSFTGTATHPNGDDRHVLRAPQDQRPRIDAPVIDASLIPTIVAAHPVGTILAVADRAGDILAARWS
jgi:choline dehydrogenase-like flavoprotein